MGQIKIPRTPFGLASLVEKITLKNIADGEQSNLNAFVNLKAINARVTQMKEFEQKANEANRLKEEMNEQKNKAMKDISKEVQRIRNLLKAQYSDDLKKLGAWGFEVDEVKKKEKETP